MRHSFAPTILVTAVLLSMLAVAHVRAGTTYRLGTLTRQAGAPTSGTTDTAGATLVRVPGAPTSGTSNTYTTAGTTCQTYTDPMTHYIKTTCSDGSSATQ